MQEGGVPAFMDSDLTASAVRPFRETGFSITISRGMLACREKLQPSRLLVEFGEDFLEPASTSRVVELFYR